jgi:hypothetical protein
MQVTKTKAIVAGGIAASAALAGSFAVTSANAADSSATSAAASMHRTKADLNPLNNSGASGKAKVFVQGQRVNVKYTARGLAKNLPHAAHIHFGAQARHECPDVFDDTNGDFRLETLEGAPAYGPVRISLTTSGDTSAASILAVDRFPTAPKGGIDYSRMTTTSKAVAAGIRHGKAIVVIHGVDYNHNGTYDFDSAGKSDLNPDLPAEATDPALCGVLHR